LSWDEGFEETAPPRGAAAQPQQHGRPEIGWYFVPVEGYSMIDGVVSKA